MDIDFQTAGEWYRKMKADDYVIPLTLYYTLIKLMKDKRIPFPAAYQQLLDEGKIKVVNKKVIFDL
jgi:hypothetical protein